MPAIRILQGTSHCLDDIYRYAREKGSNQAETWITGLVADLDEIAAHGVVSMPIPSEFGLTGFFCRCELHVVYERHFANGDTGIVTICPGCHLWKNEPGVETPGDASQQVFDSCFSSGAGGCGFVSVKRLFRRLLHEWLLAVLPCATWLIRCE